MKKKLFGAALVFGMILAAASCTTFQMSGVQMNAEMESYQKVGDFKTTIYVHEFLGSPAGANLLNISATNMQNPIYDGIRREINKLSGDAAVNVTVTYKATAVDMLLSAITWNLYAPAHAVVEGTVVKYQK